MKERRININKTYDGAYVQTLIDSAYNDGVSFGKRIGKREAEVEYETREHKEYECGYVRGYDDAGTDVLELSDVLKRILNITSNDWGNT